MCFLDAMYAGALILIEYMVFEKKPNKRNHGAGFNVGFGVAAMLN